MISDYKLYVDEPEWIKADKWGESIYAYSIHNYGECQAVGFAHPADLAVLFAHSPELHEVSQEILALLRTMPIDNNLPAIKRLEQVLQKINRGEGR